jgi:hypothetical protein
LTRQRYRAIHDVILLGSDQPEDLSSSGKRPWSEAAFGRRQNKKVFDELLNCSDKVFGLAVIW